MKLTAAIQEALIALLCFDSTPGGGKLVRGLVPAETYDPYYTDLASAAFQFIDKYSTVPGEHTLDLFNQLCAQRPDSAEIYRRIHESLEQTRHGVNREYVIAQAKTFARFQSLRRGLADALEQLKNQDESGVQEAEAALQKSLKSTIELFDPGLLLTDTSRSLGFLDRESGAFPTGIKELDALDLGPARGRLHVMMAPKGRGKSWWLVHLAKYAVLRHMRVLYVSLELSEEEVAQRCFQSLFSISKRESIVTRQSFAVDELGRFTNMDSQTIVDRPHFQQHDIRTTIINKVRTFRSLPIRIKRFPTGTLTVPQLEAFLDGLEGSNAFIPDLILVDYPDLMKIDPRYERQEVGAIVKDLRGIGIKRNAAVAIVTQSNREGESAKVLRGRHVGADYSKTQTADTVFTYNQTDAEHRLGLARIYVDKGRTDMDRFQVLISQAYALGQFVMDSAKMVQDYWSHVESHEGDQAAE